MALLSCTAAVTRFSFSNCPLAQEPQISYRCLVPKFVILVRFVRHNFGPFELVFVCSFSCVFDRPRTSAGFRESSVPGLVDTLIYEFFSSEVPKRHGLFDALKLQLYTGT